MDITAVLESERKVKTAKRALTDFINRERELWNITHFERESPRFETLEQANEYLNSRKAQLEELGMADRMVSEVKHTEHGYNTDIKYVICFGRFEPKISVVGRTLQLKLTISSTLEKQCYDKFKKILTDNGGIVSPL